MTAARNEPAGAFVVAEDELTRRPVPQGWLLQPAGQWDGRQMVVAYDPRRHDIAVTAGDLDAGQAAGMLRTYGWEPRLSGPSVWQTRVNRRIVTEGSWRDCADDALETMVYAHNHQSLYDMTTTAGAAALIDLADETKEGEPLTARAYGLTVSVRPGRQAHTLWVRDVVEVAWERLDRLPRSPGVIEVVGP